MSLDRPLHSKELKNKGDYKDQKRFSFDVNTLCFYVAP